MAWVAADHFRPLEHRFFDHRVAKGRFAGVELRRRRDWFRPAAAPWPRDSRSAASTRAASTASSTCAVTRRALQIGQRSFADRVVLGLGGVGFAAGELAGHVAEVLPHADNFLVPGGFLFFQEIDDLLRALGFRLVAELEIGLGDRIDDRRRGFGVVAGIDDLEQLRIADGTGLSPVSPATQSYRAAAACREAGRFPDVARRRPSDQRAANHFDLRLEELLGPRIVVLLARMPGRELFRRS